MGREVMGAAGGQAPPKYMVGPSARIPRSGMEVSAPFDFGAIDDFEAVEAIWNYGFDSLRMDSRGRPVVLVEPTYTFPQQREKQAEMMFEGQGVPFLYLARAPVCQAFSTGRACAIVVDIGSSCTRVSPVVDGYALKKGHIVSEVGGAFISNALQEALLRGGLVEQGGVQPRALVKKERVMGGVEEGGVSSGANLASGSRPTYVPRVVPGAAEVCSKSLRKFLSLEVLDDIVDSCLHVAEIGYDASRPPEETSYELPDGSVLRIKELRETIPELHFRPDALSAYKGLIAQRQTPGLYALSSIEALGKRGHGHAAQPYPLHHLIHQSLLSCQPTLRKELCHNSELGGGFFVQQSFSEPLSHSFFLRITQLLRQITPSFFSFCSNPYRGRILTFRFIQTFILGDPDSDSCCIQAAYFDGFLHRKKVLLVDWGKHFSFSRDIPTGLGIEAGLPREWPQYYIRKVPLRIVSERH